MRKRESIILLVTFVIVFALASCVYGTAYAEGYNKQKQAESEIELVVIPATPIEAPHVGVEVEEDPELVFESFVATAYCSCEKCCGVWAVGRTGAVVGSTGRELIPQYSVAVDPDVIPYGSILVNSCGNEYRADDCGGAIKGNHIDIYFSSHEEALNWGRQNIELAIKQ